MSAPVRSIRLSEYHSATLDRNTYSSGEIFYDLDNRTLRIMNGRTAAGAILANQTYVDSAITTAIASVNIAGKANLSGATFTGAVSSPGFTGPLTGAVTGNVTGNLTGNVTGNVTGNASTATKFAASKTINGVAFDGSANINVGTLVNGANTVTLGPTGKLTLPDSSDISVVSGFLTLNNSLQIGAGGGLLNKDNATWALYGQNTDPGTIITLPGLDDATAGTPLSLRNDFSGGIELQGTTTVSGPLATTNDITVGGNAVISTAPTLVTHATNKKYVDKKAVAMAVALG